MSSQNTYILPKNKENKKEWHLLLYAWKSVYGITYFMTKIYFKIASLPRGLDTNTKWSVSQNDKNVDTAFLLWGAELLIGSAIYEHNTLNVLLNPLESI